MRLFRFVKEQIYTIPVNEVYDTDCECPLCELEKKLEKAIAVIEERDENLVLNKIDKLENQLSKLSLNIEKLASYVDE